MHFIRSKILLFSIIILCYYWTGTAGRGNFNNQYTSYHSLLSDSFLSGKLNLPFPVPPELEHSNNPYDLRQIKDPLLIAIYNDLSLYKNKIYLYFGPAPVVTFYIPFFILTGMKSTDAFAVFAFTLGIIAFAVALLVLVYKKYFPTLPSAFLDVGILLVSFANLGLYLLRRPSFYEVAISSGSFFLIGGIYFLCLFLREECKNKDIILFLASLFIGISSGCRFHFFYIGIILLALFYFICLKGKENTIKNFFLLITPALSCYFLLLIYNYLRFDSFFENGFNYQMVSAGSIAKGKAFMALSLSSLMNMGSFYLSNFCRNLFFYFFNPPILDSKFPYIVLGKWTFPEVYGDMNVREPMGGIFATIPFTLMLPLGLFFYLLKRKVNLANKANFDIVFPKLEIFLLMTATFFALLILLVLPFVTMRYIADFSTFIIVASWINWAYFYLFFYEVNVKKNIFILGIVLSVVSIVFGFAFSILGCNRGLIEQNPQQYLILSDFFK